VLYYDCFSGISGDMNLGAFLDLGVGEMPLRSGLERLGVAGYDLRVGRERRRGIAGTRVEVRLDPGARPAARNLASVRALIADSGLDERIQSFSRHVFERLADAESRVHDVPPDRVHFHEVGAIDALVDIVGAAICLHDLGWPIVVSSPVELGSGFARCAHGSLPVPAPATLELLAGVPTRRGAVPFEATTPTGAALLVTAADRFDEAPALVPLRVGHGIGARDGPLPNLLRLILADPVGQAAAEDLVQLECNIDDMNPEFYPHIVEQALHLGARDAWLTQLVMKKGRPGILVTILCDAPDARKLSTMLLTETSTLGVRRRGVSRSALERTTHALETRFGAVPVKTARLPDGSRRAKPEFEACRRIALKLGLPLREVYAEVERRLEAWNGG
jgi:uncharacterized protein (TIGR00299 family) protein